ncbi:MAG: hypothetical protein HYT82_02990, partial [Candidatus Harrisonbacteria bacterium]|nr:hypothetical protein [Candidatus Harrisonbacteria bacterium]
MALSRNPGDAQTYSGATTRNLAVDNGLVMSTYRSTNPLASTYANGWYDVAKFYGWEMNAEIVFSLGGSFTGDELIIDAQSSYTPALNNGYAGPTLNVRRTNAHNGNRFQQVRVGYDASGNYYVQVYLATDTAAQTDPFWGKTVIFDRTGGYYEANTRPDPLFQAATAVTVVSTVNLGSGTSGIGQAAWQTGAWQGFSWGTSNAERMRITAGGSVGIGTTQPSSTLHVAGTVTATAFSGPLTGALSASYTSAGVFGSNSTKGNYEFQQTTTTASVLFVDANNSRVGIGTASPGYLLHIKTASVADILTVENTGANSNPNIRIKNDARNWLLQTVGARSDNFEIYDEDASATRLAITTGGSIGLGTTGPGAKLHLNRDDTTRTDFFIENNDLSANQEIGIIRFDALDDGSAAQSYAAVTGMISSATAGAEIGRLDFETAVAGSLDKRVSIVGGNVGIGTTAPDSKLHVVTSNASGAPYGSSWTDRFLVVGAAGIGGGIGIGWDSTLPAGIIQSAIPNTGYRNLALNPNGGSVGIGTTGPGDKLQVAGGGIYVNNSVTDFAAIRVRPADGANTARIQFVGDNSGLVADVSGVQTAPAGGGTPTDGNLVFRVIDGGSAREAI